MTGNEEAEATPRIVRPNVRLGCCGGLNIVLLLITHHSLLRFFPTLFLKSDLVVYSETLTFITECNFSLPNC